MTVEQLISKIGEFEMGALNVETMKCTPLKEMVTETFLKRLATELINAGIVK